MDREELIGHLAAISGPPNVTADPGLLTESGFRPGCMPDAIVFPENKYELQEIVKWASKNGISVIPVGGGSQIDRVLTPFRGGIGVSLRRLNRILELEPGNLSVRAEAGVLNRDLQKVLMPHNLYLPVLSFCECSTLGGETAANTAGPRSYRHGRTGDYVLGLEFVSPSGSLVRTGGKTVKNASGYDFIRLLAGSWGTNGIITEITMKLKTPPEDEYVALVEFDSPADAAVSAGQILSQRLSVASLGVLCGPAFSECFGTSPESLLFVAFEGFRETVADHKDRLLRIVSGRRCREYAEKQATKEFWENHMALRRDNQVKASGAAIYDRRIQDAILSRALPFTRRWNPTVFLDLCSGMIDFTLNDYSDELPPELTGFWLSLKEELGREKLYLSFADPPARPLMDRLRAGIDPGRIMFPCNKLLREVSHG